jgi:hypothetical protein
MVEQQNHIKISAEQLPITIDFRTKKGEIKEYVLKTNLGSNNHPSQSILVLNKKEKK